MNEWHNLFVASAGASVSKKFENFNFLNLVFDRVAVLHYAVAAIFFLSDNSPGF